jgi:hypothetical protein
LRGKAAAEHNPPPKVDFDFDFEFDVEFDFDFEFDFEFEIDIEVEVEVELDVHLDPSHPSKLASVSSTWSMSASVWSALTWNRIRSRPAGTTG